MGLAGLNRRALPRSYRTSQRTAAPATRRGTAARGEMKEAELAAAGWGRSTCDAEKKTSSSMLRLLPQRPQCVARRLPSSLPEKKGIEGAEIIADVVIRHQVK